MKLLLNLRRTGILESEPYSFADIKVTVDVETTSEGVYCPICKCHRYENISVVEKIEFLKCSPRVLNEAEAVDVENEISTQIEQILRSLPSCAVQKKLPKDHTDFIKEKFRMNLSYTLNSSLIQ